MQRTDKKQGKSTVKAKPAANGKPKYGGKSRTVVIRTVSGQVASIPINDDLKKEAEYWCRRLDSRSRLNDADRLAMQKEAEEHLAKLSIDDAKLRDMAENAVVQVTIPFDESDLAPDDFADSDERSTIEPALTMPWEYVLSAATKKYRSKTPLCVVRHIEGNNEAMEKARPATSFGFVETAPAEFAKHYDFSTERELVEGAFGDRKLTPIGVSPTIDELQSALMEHNPRVVHVTGIDTRLGRRLKEEDAAAQPPKTPQVDPNGSQKPGAGKRIDETDKNRNIVAGAAAVSTTSLGAKRSALPSAAMEALIPSNSANTDRGPGEIVDGLYFYKDNQAKEYDFREVAEALTRGKEKPQLIGFNTQYSGARIAPYCVAMGAREAIGVQNTLDDELAERFFIRFYQHWIASRQDSLAAFIAAWEFIRPMGDSVKGTGIIMWFNSNIFARRAGSKLIEPCMKGINRVYEQLKLDRVAHGHQDVVADPKKHNIKDLVRVKVETSDVITPCMLHYGESVLNSLEFTFLNLNPSVELPVECVRDIDVEVTLNVGPDSYPYRTQVSLGLDHPKLELANSNLTATDENPAGGIKVPLTSQLLQSASDNIRATLFIDINWKGQPLLKHTYSVDIAPVNEWRLNKKDSLLQPMFLQPRDKAVKEIVIAAQKYLRCLEGSPRSGFRGYQATNIEPQIEAIWSSLLYDFKLDYVSPPPSYNEGTQRLRTPSQVLRERRGTCVDLALLFASCLEWIELYPVVFNTTKHAFVGCWRYADCPDPDNPPINAETEEEILAYEKFFEMHKKGEFSRKETMIDGYPWVLTPEDFNVVSDLVYQGAIIPLETVCLTEYRLYTVARDYAISYFIEEQETEDSIQLVRSANLTAASLDGFYPGEFESLTDIASSRQFLQPLPLSLI